MFENQLKSLHNTNIILGTIPYRYDLHNNNKKHKTVSEVNKALRDLTYKYAHFLLLDLYLLERFYHNKQRYHINPKGKKYVSILIHEIIDGKHSIQIQELLTI